MEPSHYTKSGQPALEELTGEYGALEPPCLWEVRPPKQPPLEGPNPAGREVASLLL